MSKINIRDWKETSKREDRKIAKKQKKRRKMKVAINGFGRPMNIVFPS